MAASCSIAASETMRGIGASSWRKISRLPLFASLSGFCLKLETISPFVDLAIGFLLGHAIAILNLTSQHLTLSIDLLHIIVCQLAPLLAHVTYKLFPATLNSIPYGV